VREQERQPIFKAGRAYLLRTRKRARIEDVARVTWDAIRKALAGRDPVPIRHCTGRAAVAIVLRDGPHGIEVLFIHRAEHPEDPWSGHMAFPGGRAEADEPPLATAIRESAEEVGLDLERAESLGALDEVQAVRRVPVDMAIAPFVFRVGPGTEPRPNYEVSATCWFPLEDLMGERFRSTYDYAEAGGVLRFPCLRVGDKVIWGLTYRMFGELAMRVRGSLNESGTAS
jgi:8-oxo-dGTP pyrophosphatase MutT (NUDIX family)